MVILRVTGEPKTYVVPSSVQPLNVNPVRVGLAGLATVPLCATFMPQGFGDPPLVLNVTVWGPGVGGGVYCALMVMSLVTLFAAALQPVKVCPCG